MTATGAGGGPARVEASGDRPVAAASIAVAVSGDHARVVTLPREAVTWARDVDVPPGSGSLPGAASGLLVGRDEDLDRVRRLLRGEGPGGDPGSGPGSGPGGAPAAVPGSVVVTQTGAIHGLGGVGKSTLALHYAHRHRAEYGLVWWITADSPEAIVSGLGALAVRLCPQWAGTAGADERAAWAITWLGWHTGWLLVLDNVEDPAHLHPYLGTLTGGHVLATSRRAVGWHRVGPAMPLGLLAPDAAADLLCRLAFGGRPATAGERAQAEDLARDLGYLPLALEQAGAYVHETGTPFADYRRSLGLMLAEPSSDIDPERTIARIWDHTLRAVGQREPLAVDLLYAMAWLAPDDISRDLLAPLAPDGLALGRALGALHAYTMVTFGPDGTMSVHRLVQTVLRARAAADAEVPLRGRDEAERAAAAAVPDEEVSVRLSPAWERLIPHVMALVDSEPAGRATPTATTGLYHDCAQYLFRRGRDAQTLALRKAVLDGFERRLGEEDPEALTARHNLACAHRAAGDVVKAVELLEQTLAQRVRVQGDTHRYTLIARNQLAITYYEAGQLERSMALFEETLAQQVEVLGETHADTLVTRGNLAFAYLEAGDVDLAIALHEETLAQYGATRGDLDPETLVTRHHLARAYQEAGDLERATTLFELTLLQEVQVLGDTHPTTLNARRGLAYAYALAGDAARAVELLEVAVTLQTELLGAAHPDTVATRRQLDEAHQAAGLDDGPGERRPG
ncbi:MAG: tetratricopeptide repeat protein [Streptomyces sp.]|nr:tetratricopeptide repeat protein [Streptomyces sp.]